MSRSWTCSRCGLRVRFLSGREPADGPPSMSEFDGATICVGCRRTLIADRARDSFDGRDAAKLRQHVTRALVADELERDPSRSDVQIAKAARTNLASVRAARRKAKS